MTDEKSVKRDIRAIWAGLKHERRSRSKLFNAGELETSGKSIVVYGEQLLNFAARMREIENATAPEGEKAKSKPKRKAKRTAVADA